MGPVNAPPEISDSIKYCVARGSSSQDRVIAVPVVFSVTARLVTDSGLVVTVSTAEGREIGVPTRVCTVK